MRFLSKSLSVAVVAAMSVPALAQDTMEELSLLRLSDLSLYKMFLGR